MKPKILLCSLAFSSIVSIVKAYPLGRIKKDRQQSMQESTFTFSNILYPIFLRIRRCRLRSRFLGCINAGRVATSFPAKVPSTSSSRITRSLIYSFKEKSKFKSFIIASFIVYSLMTNNRSWKIRPSFNPWFINPLCPLINWQILHTGLCLE